MEHNEASLSPTRAVALRVGELRKRRGLTAAQLAEQMTRIGIPWKRGVVAKLENGLRGAVSVEELLALATVLDVAPVHLLVPFEDEQPYQVTPTQVEPAGAVRDWVRGAWYLPGADLRRFFSELPPHEYRPPEPGDSRMFEPGRLGTYAERLGQNPEWLRRFIERDPTGPSTVEARRLLAALESREQEGTDG